MTRLLRADDSLLFVVDVQERFIPVMANAEGMLSHCLMLIKAATILGIPVLFTEQYSKGLGPTVSSLLAAKPDNTAVIEKMTFGALGNPAVAEHIANSGKKQIVLCGIETQVCINQTAHQLMAEGYQVHVVEDAITSRNLQDREIALKKIYQSGGIPGCVESTLMEWLVDARDPRFKGILGLIK